MGLLVFLVLYYKHFTTYNIPLSWAVLGFPLAICWSVCRHLVWVWHVPLSPPSTATDEYVNIIIAC
jgi:hypothetical protein